MLEFPRHKPLISFTLDDNIRELLGFNPGTDFEDLNLSPKTVDNLSPKTVDIFSFDKVFVECDIAQRMTFKDGRSGKIHKSTMDVDPGYKYIDKIMGRVQSNMVETKDFFQVPILN